MTTVWRPKVRIPVPDIDGANVDEKRREESTTKGTKRKRAPRTKGPCEHGVKHRSRCKVCSACPHGRRRLSARSAVGHQSASTVVSALCARSAVGHKYASTVVSALSARSAVGHQSASTVVSALNARSAVGINLRARSSALYMQGVRWCINLRARSSSALSARSAVGTICEHGRERSRCKECGGSAICEHGRQRSSARSAVGHQSASTVVVAMSARSAVGAAICEHGRQRHRCKECRAVR